MPGLVSRASVKPIALRANSRAARARALARLATSRRAERGGEAAAGPEHGLSVQALTAGDGAAHLHGATHFQRLACFGNGDVPASPCPVRCARLAAVGAAPGGRLLRVVVSPGASFRAALLARCPCQAPCSSLRKVWPNMSFNVTRRGKPPWPPSAQVHHAPCGQGALPRRAR